MSLAIEARADETAAAYEAFHSGWEDRVEAEAAALADLGPDLILANVPYLTLAAAARCRIPAVGMSSLNWAEPYWDYCGTRPEAARIHAEIVAAYRQADLFLLPEPSMPMKWLPQRQTIGTLARIGAPRRAELCAALGVNAEQSLVLVTGHCTVLVTRKNGGGKRELIRLHTQYDSGGIQDMEGLNLRRKAQRLEKPPADSRVKQPNSIAVHNGAFVRTLGLPPSPSKPLASSLNCYSAPGSEISATAAAYLRVIF